MEANAMQLQVFNNLSEANQAIEQFNRNNLWVMDVTYHVMWNPERGALDERISVLVGPRKQRENKFYKESSE